MNKKDHYNTIERLTNAMESIATMPDPGIVRAKSAISALLPLKEEDFPVTAIHIFSSIIDSAGKINNNTATNLEIELVLKSVWKLYWEMTENTRYQ